MKSPDLSWTVSMTGGETAGSTPIDRPSAKHGSPLRDASRYFAIPLSCPGLPCLVRSRSTFAGSDSQARFAQPPQISLQRAPRGGLPKRPERHLVMDIRCILMDEATLPCPMYLHLR